jgi:hypothetical protein
MSASDVTEPVRRRRRRARAVDPAERERIDRSTAFMARWYAERLAFARLRVERGRQMEEELLAKLLAGGRELEEVLATDRNARAALAVVRRYRRWADEDIRRGIRELERLERERVAPMASACHAIHDAAQASSPHVVKVVLDAEGYALYFSRARIPYPRSANAACYRHAGIYAYRASFLAQYAALAPAPLEQAESLEQLRALWHGHRIAIVVSEEEIPPGVDTPADLEAVLRMLR